MYKSFSIHKNHLQKKKKQELTTKLLGFDEVITLTSNRCPIFGKIQYSNGFKSIVFGINEVFVDGEETSAFSFENDC